MRYLSLLLIAALFVTNAYAQDTIKVHPPKLSLHQLWRDITSGAPPVERMREHQDSLFRYRIQERGIPPEGHHPAVYLDGGFGYAFLGVHGLSTNYSLNYQAGDGLLTFKGTNISSWRPADNPYNHRIYLFGDNVKSNSLDELDLLYGERFVNRADQDAINISAGIGVASRYFYYYDYPNKIQTRHQNSSTYPGVPLEANWQIFARRFGASFNIKLSGDVSKYSFASIGVAMGLGYHYKN